MPVTDIDALRQERGQGDEPVEVPLSPRLTVKVRLVSAEMMVYLGMIPNHLAQQALEFAHREGKAETISIDEMKRTTELQDAFLARIIEEPKYAPLDVIKKCYAEGKPAPAGHLYLGMMTPREVGAAFHLLYNGMDSFRRLLEERRKFDTALQGSGLREGASGDSGPEPPPAELAEVLAERSHLDESAARTEEAAGVSA